MQSEILNGRYLIIENLGGGGFGETYLATDEWLGGDNRCVVKQLKPNIINKVTLRLFEQEAQVLFKLGTHDQIPHLLAHFEQEEKFYLVQEYIEGHDLSEEIEEGRCWNETKVIELLKEILQVLEFVHQNNVIHRDIKPGNIMRRSDGKIVLIDFGAVKQLTNQTTAATVSTHVVGTPGYMPQEQIYNNTQPCSDIYAVGMLAIEALLGEDPVDIPTDSKTNEPIWRDKADVNSGLADIIDKMVRFSFEERYQSVSEVLNAINNLSLIASHWNQRGEVLCELRKYEKALKAFNKAIELEHDYLEALINCAWVLVELGNINEALLSFKRAFEIKPDCLEAFYETGLRFVSLNRLQEAARFYDQVIEIQPDNNINWIFYGLLLLMLQRPEAALPAYDRAIKIKPDDYIAWNYRGKALLSLQRNEAAIDAFDQAIKINSNHIDAWINRNHAFSNLGNYDEALACCDRAIKYKQDYSSAWTARGIVLNHLEKYDEAITAFKKAIEIKKDEAQTWYGWGNALYYTGKYQEAISFYEAATQLNPYFAYAWYQSGMSLLSLGSYEKAVNCFNKAIQLKKDNIELWMGCGTALNNLERHEESFAAFDKVVKIQPDEYFSWVARGGALYALGRFQEAIYSCEKALTIKPDYEIAIQQIQNIQKQSIKLRNKKKIIFLRNSLLATIILVVAYGLIRLTITILFIIVFCYAAMFVYYCMLKIPNILFPIRPNNQTNKNKR